MDRKIGILTVRELTGILLLAAMLLGGLLSSRYMARQQEKIAKDLEDSAWMALSDRWSDARETAGAAKEEWETSWGIRAAFADHTPMEQIDDLFGELSVYAAAGERTEFARGCVTLASRLRAMGNAHRLSWQNVL